eukprot:g20479.t1
MEPVTADRREPVTGGGAGSAEPISIDRRLFRRLRKPKSAGPKTLATEPTSFQPPREAGKGQAKGQSAVEEATKCANADCDYLATWHPTHCCGMCASGKGHGPNCEQLEGDPWQTDSTAHARCASQGCIFSATWHPSLCCDACGKGAGHGPKCEQKRFELSKCARSECTFLAQHNGGYCCQACAWGGGRHGVQCTDVDLARFALPNRLPLADAAKDARCCQSRNGWDRSQRCFVNLQYAEASVFGETKPLCLDLTLPPTADASKGLPCVIFCHGGRWRRGSHKVFMGSVWSELLLSMGWAVASVQYRFLQEAPWPACLADLRCAVRMLRLHAAEFQLDPEWLVAMGHSAGGHLVSALPSDDPFHDADLRHVGEGVSGEVKAIITVAGAFKGMARLTKGNVFELLKADHWPQFLALHGTKDATVPCAMSEDFVAQLVSLKVPAELVRLEGHGHELLPPPKEATAAVAAFLQRLRARG